MIDFMGKQLVNPLIASSCITTESVSNILRLAQNCVQGAILKSCADYKRSRTQGKRQFAVDASATYASSPCSHSSFHFLLPAPYHSAEFSYK